MLHMLFKRGFAAFAALALAGPALAQTAPATPVSVGASWTFLGYGPIAIDAPTAAAGSVAYLLAPSQPAAGAAGRPVPASPPLYVTTTDPVWAICAGCSSPATVLTGALKQPSAASGAATLAPDGGLFVHATGSTGADASANKPALPNVGANFGGSGPWAGLVLLATLPADPTRIAWLVQNQGVSDIVLVFDDGTAAAGAQPVNATALVYGAAGKIGGNGGGDFDTSFKGRIQLYGAAGSIAALARR